MYQRAWTPEDERLHKLMLVKARKEESGMQRESKTSRAIELERFDGSYYDDCSRYDDHIFSLRFARQAGHVQDTLTENFITQLHGMCFPMWEFPGEFRPATGKSTIKGADFEPTVGWKVPQAIADWIESWFFLLNRNENPFIIMAMLHIAFERIHPFRDGNGRIGRILVNYMAAYLGRGVIALLPSDKQKYLDLLRDQNVRGLASLFERRELK